jgi:hypothetical protein
VGQQARRARSLARFPVALSEADFRLALHEDDELGTLADPGKFAEANDPMFTSAGTQRILGPSRGLRGAVIERQDPHRANANTVRHPAAPDLRLPTIES